MHIVFAICRSRQKAPDFVGSEAEDGSDQADKSFRDLPDGGLRAESPRVLRCKRVESILQYVEIKRAQFGVTKFIQRVIDAVKFELVITRAALVD